MVSKYLTSLSPEKKEKLRRDLWESQQRKCFISNEPIDFTLHQVDIDHVVPLAMGGKDSPENFALTLSSWNKSKQASDLRIARLLAHFHKIKQKCPEEDPKRPNLSDILQEYGGACQELGLKIEENHTKFSFSEIGDNTIYSSTIFQDELSGIKFFFAKLPIQYIHHDSKINPRAIGSNLRGLLEEFFKKRPQLHISLAWTEIKNIDIQRVKIHLFDGQHKAAAQVLLGAKSLPVRVFVNPDYDLLMTTNTNAGTVLRQVAFDKSVQRYLGSEIYRERIARYQKAYGKDEDFFDFSEQDILKFFRGEAREVKRYIIDDIRASVTHHKNNKLRDFVESGGRAKDKPLSYSAIEKTFFSLFICPDVLETPLNYKIEIGENPRQLEKEQLVKLLNVIAEEIYIDKFDTDIGTARIEKKLIDGRDEDITDKHLRAFRMSREEILFNWLKFVELAAKQYYLIQGIPIKENALFHYKFPEPLWESIRRVIQNIAKIPLWVNRQLASTVFSGKQSHEYWHSIFETGKTPDDVVVMPTGLNLNNLLEE